MLSYHVIVHTRALNMSVRAEFETEALASTWAHRIQKAKEHGAAVTLGNARLVGTEILRVEFGHRDGPLTMLGMDARQAEEAKAKAAALAGINGEGAGAEGREEALHHIQPRP